MEKITIRQYTPAQLKLFSPSDNFIGYVNNSVEALRVRVDIAKHKLEGYYFMYGSIKINIDKLGMVDNWPEGVYSESLDLCIELRNMQKQ